MKKLIPLSVLIVALGGLAFCFYPLSPEKEITLYGEVGEIQALEGWFVDAPIFIDEPTVIEESIVIDKIDEPLLSEWTSEEKQQPETPTSELPVSPELPTSSQTASSSESSELFAWTWNTSTEDMERCVILETTQPANLILLRGDESSEENITTTDTNAVIACHTYTSSATSGYEVSLSGANQLFSLDISFQQVTKFSGTASNLATLTLTANPLRTVETGAFTTLPALTQLELTDTCIDSQLLASDERAYLDANFSGRENTQSVCLGEIQTKPLPKDRVFARISLWGNETKKADLKQQFPQTFGHVFTNEEVYIYDLSTFTTDDLINLPATHHLIVKATKIWTGTREMTFLNDAANHGTPTDQQDIQQGVVTPWFDEVDTAPLRRIRTPTTSQLQHCITLKTTSPASLEIDRGDEAKTETLTTTTANKTFCHFYDEAGKYSVTIDNPGLLTFLNLANQHLTSFQGGGATNLEHLDLSANQLKAITTTSFPNFAQLGVLDLSQNEIREIEPGTFDNTHKLNYLDISRNQLKELKAWTLSPLTKLTKLGIYENQIETVDTTEDAFITRLNPNWKKHQLAPTEQTTTGSTGGFISTMEDGVITPMSIYNCNAVGTTSVGGTMSVTITDSGWATVASDSKTCSYDGDSVSLYYPDDPLASCRAECKLPTTYTYEYYNESCGSCNAACESDGTQSCSYDYRCRSSDGSWVSSSNCSWSDPSYTDNNVVCHNYAVCDPCAWISLPWSCPSTSSWTYGWVGWSPAPPRNKWYATASISTSYGSANCTNIGEGGNCVLYESISSSGKLCDSRNCPSNSVQSLDDTAPVCGTNDGSIVWTKNDRNITVQCSDAKSWCTQPSYSQNFTTDTKTANITISDVVGNTQDCPVNVYVDKTMPNCRVDSYSPATWPILPPVTITVKCTQDAFSPIHIKDLSGTVYTGTVTFTSTVSNNGTYTFDTRDDAGNTIGVQTKVNRIGIGYDIRYKPGPDGSKTGFQTNDPWFTGHRTPTSGNVTVQITVDETGVFLHECSEVLTLSGGALISGNPLNSGRYNARNDSGTLPAGNLGLATGFTFTAPENSTGAKATSGIDYQLCYTNKDNVTGIILPEVYWIDRDPPECHITYTPPQPAKDASGNYINPTDEYVMAHLDCTDYSNRRVTNNSWSQDHLFTENGEFDFRVIDEAGNATGAVARINNGTGGTGWTGGTGGRTKAEVDRIVPRRTLSYTPPESWGLTSWNVDATITMSRTGVTLTFIEYTTGSWTPCPEGYFINKGTTPVLPSPYGPSYASGSENYPRGAFPVQNLTFTGLGGLSMGAYEPTLKWNGLWCYPSTDSGSNVIENCNLGPQYMYLDSGKFWNPIHPGVVSGNQISCSGTGSTAQQTTVYLTGNTYTFTVPQDGRYLFTYDDNRVNPHPRSIGGTGNIPTKVTRIDKIKPEGKVTYDPATSTPSSVTATITLSESGTIPWRTKVSDLVRKKVYPANLQETVKIYDLAGNPNTVAVAVTRIYSPGWPWSTTLKPDNCPNGDNSPSYYDGTCDGEKEHWVAEKCSIAGSKYTDEEEQGYLFACDRDITTMRTIQKARIHDTITRAEMAKIISVYTTQVLGREVPNNKPQCRQFKDYKTVNEELQGFITTACEIEQMGYRANGVDFLTYFRPNDPVSRAEVWIIISRILRGTKYAGTEILRYQSHLAQLKKEGVMNYTDNPMKAEIRGNVFIMLHRLYQKGYVKPSLKNAAASIDDFTSNADARNVGYFTSGAASSTVAPESFAIVAPASIQKGVPFDFAVAVSKSGVVNTNYTGKIWITIEGLTTKDYTIANQGNYTFSLTDKGKKIFTKGLTINKEGIYTIKVTNTTNTITGTRKITVE